MKCFIKNLKLRNLFQPSTLKAILYVLSAVGLTVDDATANWICGAGLVILGGYDSLRDESVDKVKPAVGSTSHSAMMIFFMAAMATGCAMTNVSKWCDNIPEDSYSVICEVASHVGTTPENVSTVVKVADLMLLDETHTAQQAYNFFTLLEQQSEKMQLMNGMTYGVLVSYIAGIHKKLNPKIQAAIILITDFQADDIPEVKTKILSEYDWLMIDRALAEQKAAVAPFL